ncbi:MAG: 3-deoxy-8-phosphooctulonate synthase, partial [Elusimicrobia bacterium]|nr:3-deoxy-8-phosphooctulonate synthase [Elusimicrobiota bacterium]
MPARPVRVSAGGVAFANDGPVRFIGGPCALESEALLLRVGRALRRAVGTGFVLKCSADKANRTAPAAFRGPGFEAGLRIL